VIKQALGALLADNNVPKITQKAVDDVLAWWLQADAPDREKTWSKIRLLIEVTAPSPPI
jgi:hypothetical protein